MELNSCLYECSVTHHRFEPKVYHFTHKTFMFYIDLDELECIQKNLRFISLKGWNVFQFSEKDHLDFGKPTLKQNITHYARTQGVKEDIVKIMLLTNLRTFGYIFNPVSFYVCFNSDGHPLCVIPEIGNTFGELKPYILTNDKLFNGRFQGVLQKHYYISPFIDLDVFMDFKIKIPGERLDIRINDFKQDKRILCATMSGKRATLDNKTLLFYAIKFPLITLKIIFLIHWHAGILYMFKRLPFHKKEDNMELQKEVQRVWVKK
ncbi:MAG: DUF1365 domain-containing protein [Candidatus Omnitrophica bacterium]|nr:DUF1365 domain-containing protein [Candidatus Omnitrophota bacterium]